MKQKSRKILSRLCMLLFVLSGVFVCLWVYDGFASEKINKEAHLLAFSSAAESMSAEAVPEHKTAVQETAVIAETVIFEETIPMQQEPEIPMNELPPEDVQTLSEEETEVSVGELPAEDIKTAAEQETEIPADEPPAEDIQTVTEQKTEIPEDELPSEDKSTVVEQKPEEIAPRTLEEELQLLLGLNLDSLQQVNERVLGWIKIPNTPIDYPLLRVRDNNEYLRRAWDGSYSYSGCIFLECQNSDDFSDFNTLIYGHKMGQGKMFGSLHYYQKQEYLAEHPYVLIATDDAVRRYEIFAAYEADVVSDTYRLYFEDESKKQAAIEHYLESSVIEGEITPTTEDLILTLSTCIGTGMTESRWVVQAVLVEEIPRQ